MNAEYISHEGVAHNENPPGRGSGRFPWGSGANPHQHIDKSFYYKVKEMRQSGMTDREITDALLGKDVSVNVMKARYSIDRSEQRKINYQKALKVLEECNYNYSKAARELGMERDTSLRSFLQTMANDKQDRIQSTADMLEEYVKEHMNDENKGMVDVSKGIEHTFGVTSSTKDVAIEALKQKGYVVQNVYIKQYGTGKNTTMTVLAPPGTDPKEIKKNFLHIGTVADRRSDDQGITWTKLEQPTSVSSDRVAIRYAENGGKEMDGVIEIRRGLNDINLGSDTYAQVRIAVDDTHYLKGMAVYADDLPPGVDIRFNTNKTKDVPMLGEKDNSVLKPLKARDEKNPSAMFGATIKPNGQSHYVDENGVERLSPVNKITGEGDWDDWSRKLSSQFLSKQGPENVRLQTEYSIEVRSAELEEIKRLTNPVIKKKLLEDYAENCESNSADLKVQGLRGQAYQVLLPVPSLKDDEIYAPNYHNGERIALIRYPHQNISEIPLLTVNNNNKEARARITPGAKDAVGINAHVADRLSGADFDGDTVTVLPLDRNLRFEIKSIDRLPGLENYDYQTIYKLPKDAEGVKPQTKQTQMGITTNLIQDMSLSSEVTTADIEKATKHAMVVIDCEKHRLDYRQSEKDNGIAELKIKYQTIVNDDGTKHVGGGATIVTRAAKKHNYVPEMKEYTSIKSLTDEKVAAWNYDKYKTLKDVQDAWARGEKILVPTNATEDLRKEIKVPKGKTPEEVYTKEELERLARGAKKIYRTVGTKTKTVDMKPMYLTDDATTLVREKDNEVEMAYAKYANDLKALAREARSISRSIDTYKMDPSAKRVYAKEVASLNSKLKDSEMNAPRERAAQAYAQILFNDKLKENPDMDKEHRKKYQNQSLSIARQELGAKKKKVEITPKEWEAIQARAISATKLQSILTNADSDKVRELATPKQNVTLSDREKQLIKTLKANGETNADIAKALGCSTSTVSRIANE